MRRHVLVTMSLAASLAGASAAAQIANSARPVVQSTPARSPDRNELLRQVKLCEDALRHAESVHAAPETLAKIELVFGGLELDLGAYPQSEAAMQQAVKLLRGGSPQEVADALGRLAVVHIAMGEGGKAEKEDHEELALLEQAGEVRGSALARIDLANAEIKQQHFSKAIVDAQEALKVISDDPAVDASDRIAARQTLGSALCGARRCEEAIPVLKSALELSKTSYGQDSLATGIDYYLLGQVAWQCGDPADAAGWMQRGTARMKVDLGWGHVIYLRAMSEYAKFLRERGQTEQADSAEREVRMARSVVDARTLSAAPAPASGLR